eukprot:6318743-Amphidinium_carterae.1
MPDEHTNSMSQDATVFLQTGCHVEPWPSVWVQDCARSMPDEHTNGMSKDATVFWHVEPWPSVWVQL